MGRKNYHHQTKASSNKKKTTINKNNKPPCVSKAKSEEVEEYMSPTVYITDNARSEATFTFKIRRFNRLKDRVFSPSFMIRNLPWKLQIDIPQLITDKNKEKCLGFFLHCNDNNKSSSVRCSAYVTLKIVSQKKGVKNFVRNFDGKKKEFLAWGYPDMIRWNDLLDTEKGYIKDDTVIFQAHVIADAPEGVSLNSKSSVTTVVEATTNDSNWRATKSTIRDRNELLFNNEFLADVYFIVGSSDTEKSATKRMRIPAHKFVLAIGSEVFCAMFYGSLCEKKKEIEIPDIEPKAFLNLLRYLYCDDIKLEDDSVMATLYAAEKYFISHLFDACTQYLKTNLSKNNVWLLLSQTRFFDVPDLSKRCWEVIDAETEAALEEDDFLDIHVSVLENMLKRETLSCKEICIFEAALDWALHECVKNDLDRILANKRAVLDKIWYSIRFPTMSVDEFANRVVPLGILPPEDAVNVFMHLTSSNKPSSLKYPTKPRAGCKPS